MLDPMTDVDAHTYQGPEVKPHRNRWACAIWPFIAIGVVVLALANPDDGWTVLLGGAIVAVLVQVLLWAISR